MFYNVKNYDEIPTIMQRDLALEAIAEIKYGEEFSLTIGKNTSVVAGIEESDIPLLTGYYGTVAKEGAIISLMGPYVPIFAQWKYGKGNVGSFMSDLNGTWSAQFVNDPIGRTLVNNMVQSLFPVTDIEFKEIDYILKRENIASQLNVYGINDGEKVEVTVVSLNGFSDDVPVTIAEENRRFEYDLLVAGVYDITIVKKDKDGNEIASMLIRDWLPYSSEYNTFSDKNDTGEQLLGEIALSGKGEVITEPVDVFDGLQKRLMRSFDPRFLFLIIAIVAVLIDVAVRKFKFKWPHELIREHKAKKKLEK
jgi:hypothetical protein